MGEVIDKIGAYAGWTYGRVSGTCTDYTSSGQTIHCGVSAGSLGARSGDSGGPIFIWDGYDGVSLVATLSGGYGSSGSFWGGTETTGSVGAYWDNTTSEMGSMNPLNNTSVGAPSVSGSLNGSSQAVVTWSAITASNSTATTTYQAYRTVWDASLQTFTSTDQYLGMVTALTYTDASPPFAISAYAGSAQPNPCQYSSVYLSVRSYNQGAYSTTSGVWFQGPSNGPGGVC